jgi:cobalt ECF transporter T component CbiQ/cobalamin biosynthesis protein CbiM
MQVAMHIANGIVDGPVSAAFAGLAVVGLALCLARGRADLDHRLAPMAGLVAAFIFAGQMLNFPVAFGVSGHLLGGTLAAMLVGPWIGALCVATVLVIQCLLFADGGLTALGLNITNMALIGTAAGYLLVVALLRVLPRTPAGLGATAFVASVLSVVASSQGFVVEFALGGTTELPISALAASMAGVHLLIGLGEGLIAATTVATVARVRPDLVYAWRRLGRARSAQAGPAVRSAQPAPATPATGRRARRWAFFGAGLVVTLLLAGVVSNFASSSPDGLDATALQGCTVDDEGEITGGVCIAQQEQEHEFGTGPLADYSFVGIDNPYLATGLAGVVGVLVTFGIGVAVLQLVRRRRARTRDGSDDAGDDSDDSDDDTGVGGQASDRPQRTSGSTGLHVDRDSAVHRMAPEVKIAALVLVTVVMVLTPREAFWAFGGYAALLAVVAALARVRPGWLLKRSLIEVPFVAIALALPFFGQGETVAVFGLSLHVEGLLGAWNILVKGTLGVWASLLLAATTTPRDLILGLDRLRCPQIFTQIATFMLRYLEVLGGEARRMRVARISRGYDPRFLWQVKAFATGVGALFLRAFERGERVYLAMVSRGYTGRLPAPEGPGAGALQWGAAALLPLTAAAIAVLAWR